jgi:hypothetical protein
MTNYLISSLECRPLTTEIHMEVLGNRKPLWRSPTIVHVLLSKYMVGEHPFQGPILCFIELVKIGPWYRTYVELGNIGRWADWTLCHVLIMCCVILGDIGPWGHRTPGTKDLLKLLQRFFFPRPILFNLFGPSPVLSPLISPPVQVIKPLSTPLLASSTWLWCSQWAPIIFLLYYYNSIFDAISQLANNRGLWLLLDSP